MALHTQADIDAMYIRAEELYADRLSNRMLFGLACIFEELHQLNAALIASGMAPNIVPPEGAHRFLMSGVKAAVSGQFSHVQFINPADSGHNCRLVQVGIVTTTGTSNGFCYGYRAVGVTPITDAVESAGTANWADLRMYESTCPFLVYTAANAADLMSGRPAVVRKFMGTNMPRVDACDVILPPGSSVVFVGQLANTEIRVSLEGYAWSV